MKSLELRKKLKRPSECKEHMGKELIKISTRRSKAYKCWDEMLIYIDYLEAKMDRKRKIIKQLKEKENEQRGMEKHK